jgi:uncharacterized protein
MKIWMTGSSGMVGRGLQDYLKSRGHELTALVRREKPGREEIFWNPGSGELGPEDRLDRPDVIIHLAGENIASGRWSQERKRAIRESRVSGTRLLAENLVRKKLDPEVFISASAIGFYGNRGEELLSEGSGPGRGFLAETAVEWENAAASLEERSRVIHLRFGMILSGTGGALKKMLPVFKAGSGGRLGSGKQYVSWVSLLDVVRIVEQAINDKEYCGAINVVGPAAVRNEQFTSALGEVLRRPTILPVPGWILRMLMGEMAEELLLSSQRVSPERLQGWGYAYAHPELEEALRWATSREG